MKFITRALLASSALTLTLAVSSISSYATTYDQQRSRTLDALVGRAAVPQGITIPVADDDDDLSALPALPETGSGLGPDLIDQDIAALNTALSNNNAAEAAKIIAGLNPNQISSLATNSTIKNTLANSTLASQLSQAIQSSTIANPNAAQAFVSFASAVGNSNLTKQIGKALAQAANSFESSKEGASEAQVSDLATKVDAIAAAVEQNASMQTAYNNVYQPFSAPDGTDTAAINGEQNGDQEEGADGEETGALQQLANNATNGTTNQNLGVTTTATTPAGTPPSPN